MRSCERQRVDELPFTGAHSYAGACRRAVELSVGPLAGVPLFDGAIRRGDKRQPFTNWLPSVESCEVVAPREAWKDS